ncbi:hypothetical protein TVAG_181500 [Trichomonas vaginalis G3]|uniref:Uncharacterized protein n=1 Tax=Trichomonas vaginalis (strain ATCC PRA-98 / G3) TaxID=412133 RepID=A2G210_TRIV3|nr:hypothetical protein TVAGG3_0570410 [Trichomonas vaginalis G3]EAX88802.1 hypothetical protein TVAG_181500 [Trichomonas vaginalis G3]KAI5521863.1 hypothetical protein TVAGG3_0570410 [Trichomonas vaginalis G3]|eukprot:XP_001301732.1 hypothetical protein [Trichomonas vaginalis G3]
MFLFSFLLSLQRSAPLALSRTFVSGNILTTFTTEIKLRCVGFDKKLEEQLISVLYSQRGYMHKINVIEGDQDVHQIFNTSVELITLNLNKNPEGNKELIQQHFNNNKAILAIYIVKQENCAERNSRLFATGNGWVALSFCKDEIVYENSKIAYLIIDSVKRVLTDLFDHPLSFRPLNSITEKEAQNVIIYHKSPPDANIIRDVQNYFASYRGANVSHLTYEIKSLEVICGVCEDSICVRDWLVRTPEYHLAREVDVLPVFVLPATCPANFLYGDNEVAFVSENSLQDLQKALIHSFFGFDILGEATPFTEMIIRRNSVVYPFLDLVQNFTHVINNVREVLGLGLEITDQYTINQLERYFQDFRSNQSAATSQALQGKNVLEYYNKSKDAADSAWLIWNMLSDHIGTKRVCAGNKINLYRDNFFLFRPFSYMIISIASSIAIFAFAFTKMRPKAVINILSTPPSIL